MKHLITEEHVEENVCYNIASACDSNNKKDKYCFLIHNYNGFIRALNYLGKKTDVV